MAKIDFRSLLDVSRPLAPADARRLARVILQEGHSLSFSDHAVEELEADDMDMVDVTNAMKCAECGKATVEVRRQNHRYTACGLDYVTLLNIEVHHCPECGQNEYVIPDVEGLHCFIARAVATKLQRLVPREIRFLRKYLGYSGADFAKAIGVNAATVSRWEGGAQAMTIGLERFLRLMVLTGKPLEEYPRDQIQELGSKAAAPTRLKLVARKHGWEAEHVSAAA